MEHCYYSKLLIIIIIIVVIIIIIIIIINGVSLRLTHDLGRELNLFFPRGKLVVVWLS